jgi:hypothetical protein
MAVQGDIRDIRGGSSRSLFATQLLGAVGTVSDNGDLGLVAKSPSQAGFGQGSVLELFAGALQLD